MTRRFRHPQLVQICCLCTFGLVTATSIGCTPSTTSRPAVGTTTPAPTTTADTGEPVTPAGDPLRVDELPTQEDDPKATPTAEPEKQGLAPEGSAEETPSEEQPVEDKPVENTVDRQFNPTFVVTVQWLPEPVEVPDAEAETEDDMKRYTERISDTDVTFDMVPIPGGKFMMGSPASEKGRSGDEGPRHEVVIGPFWMGKYEVTWDEFELYGLSLDRYRRQLKHRHQGSQPTDREKLVDAISRPTNPYTDITFGMGKEGYPAICMSQLSARLYCKWLSAKTGRYYRLPTEAEWEYACRAGTTTAYSFGDDAEKLDEYAWYYENSEDVERYHKVGLKQPNLWGLYDMHGNVSEWVLDQYIPDYYEQFSGKTAIRPLAAATARDPRVARGGCWDDDPDKLRSAARFPSSEEWRMQDPQIPQSIWYNTEVHCPGIRVVRPLKVPDAEEAGLYEPDGEVIKEYQEAQAGKQ